MGVAINTDSMLPQRSSWWVQEGGLMAANAAASHKTVR